MLFSDAFIITINSPIEGILPFMALDGDFINEAL